MSWKMFWTNKNNPKLVNYLYGARHLFCLFIVIILCIGLTLIFRNKKNKTKDMLFTVFAYIFLFFEILSRVVNLINLQEYSITNVCKIMIPMYICSIVVWFLIIGIFTNKNIILEFAVICGLISTLAFLLYPAVGLNRQYMTFTQIYSVGSHMLGFVICILMLTLKKVTFTIRDLPIILTIFSYMFFYGFIIDFYLLPGSDHMYLINDPLELDLPFDYRIFYGIILFVYICSFYFMPYVIKKIKNKIIRIRLDRI